MRITRVTPHLLRAPLGSRSLPLAGHDPCVTRPEALAVLVVRAETDDGPTGLGFSYSAGRARVPDRPARPRRRRRPDREIDPARPQTGADGRAPAPGGLPRARRRTR